MKKQICILLLSILSIASFGQLSLGSGWSTQYSKSYPKGTHKLGPGSSNVWNHYSMHDMKYTMSILEDPRTNKVFLSIGASDSMSTYIYNSYAFNSASSSLYRYKKNPYAQTWDPGSTYYNWYTDLWNFEYQLGNGDTITRNQTNTGIAPSTYSSHPYWTQPAPHPVVLPITSGSAAISSSGSWYSVFFTYNNPIRVKHGIGTNTLSLYSDDNTMWNNPNNLINTITLTCPTSGSTSISGLSFQRKDDNTIYVKYAETFTNSNTVTQNVVQPKTLVIDTISVIGGSLVIGNYFKMTGLDHYPTLSFEYSTMHCHGTEVYMLTSNSDSTGMYAPQYSSSIPVFGTNVNFAVPTLYCFSTNTVTVTGIDENKNLENKVMMKTYPNPSNGLFKLSFDGFQKTDKIVSVYDITGRLVTEKILDVNSNETYMDISGEAPGIYFVKLKGHTQTLKAIKQ